MKTIEELMAKKRKRLRVISSTVDGERRARMHYPVLGDENVKNWKRQAHKDAKFIMALSDCFRSRQKIHA